MSARERILDAAAHVMRTKGFAEATTREIARTAACSEALLYKHFRDKQEIFRAVLKERMPAVSRPEDLLGSGTFRDNLATLVSELIAFYRASFPIAASTLSRASVRAANRAGSEQPGGGPQAPALILQGYIEGEISAGRIHLDADPAALARVLAGAALLEAVQAIYDDAAPDEESLARRIVTAVGDGLPDG